ncbi:hypothetical protein [Sphingomonas sp. Leaf25]|uniref:hypothetical protein n=1 Tax=Sphingomonas sp. Leaf25 TaxID=1735692 RepID=UPI0006FFF5D1|nr:hypothetical protein [Sphingomonas sp. Leaf25]KQM97649.1 hypothetical protein ASE78_09780 [Sphingomonas sp. Leaf25]
MLAWIVAGLAWTMAATSLPVIQPHVPQRTVQIVTGAALMGFLLLCLQWWHADFAATEWNDSAFAIQVLGLAADSCIRSATRRSKADLSA